MYQCNECRNACQNGHEQRWLSSLRSFNQGIAQSTDYEQQRDDDFAHVQFLSDDGISRIMRRRVAQRKQVL